MPVQFLVKTKRLVAGEIYQCGSHRLFLWLVKVDGSDQLAATLCSTPSDAGLGSSTSS